MSNDTLKATVTIDRQGPSKASFEVDTTLTHYRNEYHAELVVEELEKAYARIHAIPVSAIEVEVPRGPEFEIPPGEETTMTQRTKMLSEMKGESQMHAIEEIPHDEVDLNDIHWRVEELDGVLYLIYSAGENTAHIYSCPKWVKQLVRIKQDEVNEELLANIDTLFHQEKRQ